MLPIVAFRAVKPDGGFVDGRRRWLQPRQAIGHACDHDEGHDPDGNAAMAAGAGNTGWPLDVYPT
jgi:hypothetical protein